MTRQVVVVVPVVVPYDAISSAASTTCDMIDSLEGTSCRILTLHRGIEDPRVRQVGGLMELLNDPWFLDADVLVYEYGLYNPLFQAMLLGNGKARQVVRFHNVTPESLVPPEARVLIRKSLQQIHLFSQVDEIWAVSRTNIEMLAWHGVRTSHALEIPLVVETLRRTQVTERPVDTVNILFLGRFVQSKGVLDLLAALKKVQSAGRVMFRLTMAGNQRYSNPAYLDQVKSAAAVLGDAVDYRGEVTDAERDELFRSADVFAIPSYHEGFCVPVVEALAAGCIPVGYDAHNLPRIFNGFGRLVPTGNIDALAETLEDVCAMLIRPGTPRMLELDRGEMTSEDRNLALETYLKSFAIPTVRATLAVRLSRLLTLGPGSAAPRVLASSTLPSASDLAGIEPMDTSKTPPPMQIMLPQDSSDIRDEVEILPDEVMRQADSPSLNRLPDFCNSEPGNRQNEVKLK